MKFENLKDRVGAFFSRIGRRNLIIAASFVVVAAALVGGVLAMDRAQGGFDYSRGTATGTPTDGVNGTGGASAADTYFSSVQVSRRRSRDEALEVLQGVVDDSDSTAVAKEEALAEINKLARVMETESNIETLIVAKGFSECVAVISGESANIVVRSEGLQAAQISQINEIVYEQAGILPVNIKIIER